MDSLTLKAPAKVNLRLEVVGKRADGYHELSSIFAPIDLYDKLTLTRTPEMAISVKCEGPGSPPQGEKNLCHGAARYFFERTGARGGISIKIEKEIPSGAGLGGGSSDAAATIMGMERLFGLELDSKARAQAAFSLGADVPFFLGRGPALVRGVGEKLDPVNFTDPLWLTLVFPAVFLSTAKVFSGLTMGLTTKGRLPTIMQFNFQGVADALHNDLEQRAVSVEPRVGQALAALRGSGARHVLMTGSGSAVFALFAERHSAEELAGKVRDLPISKGWMVRSVRVLGVDAFPF